MKLQLGQLSLDELYDVDTYLHQLIEELERAAAEEISVKRGREVVGEYKVGSKTYRLERVSCGKSNCKCAKEELHGPYWYAYWWENGHTKSEYIRQDEAKRLGLS
ncbi:MAG: DUF6788 family protein [Candidatus Bipolaricaulia bacterium]